MLYFVMDGRANYSVDDAEIIEAFSEPSDKKAKKYVARHYEGEDVVLVRSSSEEIVY